MVHEGVVSSLMTHNCHYGQNMKFIGAMIYLCELIQYLILRVCFAVVIFQDKDAKFRLILVESRIHRLARYYKRTSVLPPNWKYESSTASALVA